MVIAGAGPASSQGPRVTLGSTALAIGVDDTLAEQQFLGIQDAALTGRGELFVLDSRSRVLALFGPDSRRLAWTQIAAPARAARAVAVTEKGALVFDGLNGAVIPYQRRRDSLIAGTPFSVPPGSDACSIDNSVVVMGLKNGRILHRYSSSGDHLGSFGDAYETSGAFRYGLTNLGGRLACIGDTGLILVATSLWPEVRAYGVDGMLRWKHRLRDFASPAVKSSGDRLELSLREEGTDEVVSVVGISGHYAAVQVERHTRASQRRRSRRETYLLDLLSGTVRGSQVDLARLGRAWGSSASVVTHDPFPQVRVQTISVVGGQ